jgi:phosphate/sulfate permease
MDLNCKDIAEKHILNKNPIYAFNFPISLLIAIFVFGITSSYKISKNSYIVQIVIPILAFLSSMVIIDILSRNMISNEEQQKIIEECSIINKKYNLPYINNDSEPLNPEKFVNNHLLEEESHENQAELIYNTHQDTSYNTHQDTSYNTHEDLSHNSSDDIDSESVHPSPAPSNEMPNSDFTSLQPFPIEFKDMKGSVCEEPSNNGNLCSGSKNSNPDNLVTATPGPQWMPQTAEAVQNRLKNNDYTKAKCNFTKAQ